MTEGPEPEGLSAADTAAITGRIQTLEMATGRSTTSTGALPTRADFDRSLIAKMVMTVYVGAVSLYFGGLV